MHLYPPFCILEPALQLIRGRAHRLRDQEYSRCTHPQRQRHGGRDHGREQDHGTAFHQRRRRCESKTQWVNHPLRQAGVLGVNSISVMVIKDITVSEVLHMFSSMCQVINHS